MAIVNEALNELHQLYEDEKDPTRKGQLEAEYLRAIDLVEAMAGKAIGDNTEAYEKAVAAIEKANAEIKKAKKELDKFADAVVKVAKAMDMIAKVATKLA